MEFHETVKPHIDVPPLRFGTLIHASLAAYYKPGIKRGPNPAATFERLYEADLRDVGREYDRSEVEAKWAEHADLGVVMLERYIEEYGKDDEWRVIATEQPFRVIVNHPVRKTPWFWYVGIVDGVWESRRTSKLLIPDHKTTASIQLQYLRMDDQATSYWTFGVDGLINGRIISPGTKIDGVLFNFLRKAKRDERPRDPKTGQYLNKNGSESKRQPAAYHARIPVFRDWHERESARVRVLAEMEDMMRIRREAHNGEPPPGAYKNPSQFTCNGCWLLDICELHEIGQDWVEMRAMTTRTWHPYAEHEIREGR